MIKTQLLKKIFNWVKSNWIILLIIAAVGFLTLRHFTFVDAYGKLSKQFNEQSTQFHKQLENIEKVNKEWREAENKLNIAHQKELNAIRIEYDKKINNINSQRVIIQTQIVKEAKADPTTLTKKVSETFGIPVSK
jgi:hypothetical protein